MKIEAKLHWDLDKKSLETAFNKDIDKAFKAEDLGKITLATFSFPDLEIEWSVHYLGGGNMEIELVEDP